VEDGLLETAAEELAAAGIDAAPEGGAALAAVVALKDLGAVTADERIVLFNTAAGWLYRG
jgi:2-methylisocitrate lyase-like PEP mutase family enzyme